MDLMKGDEIDLDELLQSQAYIWNYTFRFMSSMSLKCAVELQIPDIIHNHGGGQPITISDLAPALRIHCSKLHYLHRLMRILVHSGFFSESETDDRQKAYALTPVSRLLRKDNPMSSRPFILAMLDPVFMKPWEYLSGWHQNDDHPSAFIAAHWETLWDYAGREPRLNHFFNDAMASDGLVAARAVLVFDLPHVVNGLQGSENLKYLGGNMLEQVPHGDVIMLKELVVPK
ncbi:hypothetical protein F3Y22_tig00110895pilonHSYRG00317 [Hibiscus syriacus]|uniref:O-methyltransferase dimerisation domain-containing protein n=1 Tax=Hibiscus syriacus TaxID=106335 RepID=A0A6A2ZFE9_HIBSY|nr:hypothetical protein F3Y22_tig00110895pilonHSYRG00317 [Hibiscus syriacus]